MKADFEKGTKICSRCKKELPLKMFGRDKSNNDGLSVYCKKCFCERTKQYYKKIERRLQNTKVKEAVYLVGKDMNVGIVEF